MEPERKTRSRTPEWARSVKVRRLFGSMDSLGLIGSLDVDLILGCMPDPNHIYNPGVSINPVSYLPGFEDQLPPPVVLLLSQNGPCLGVATQNLSPIINPEPNLPSHV
jgi:hypothetical protein